MPNRVLRASLFQSDRFLGLPDNTARVCFLACVAVADDLGNLEASPADLKRLWRDLGVAELIDIEPICSLLAGADLIRWYEHDKRRYGHIPRFRQRLRFYKRVNPRPPRNIEDNEINEELIEKTDHSKTTDSTQTAQSQSIDGLPARALNRNEVKRSEEKRNEEKARAKPAPVDNSVRADAKTEPPPGYFEQVKTDLKRGNGASHAITPAQALLGGKWWSEQSGIAAMAATLELKPASGETFVQLKERCFAEIARRKA